MKTYYYVYLKLPKPRAIRHRLLLNAHARSGEVLCATKQTCDADVQYATATEKELLPK